MAKLLVAASCEISTRLGNRLRKFDLEEGLSTRPRLDEEIDAACSPWPSSPAAPSPQLEEWVMETLASKGDGLYLERKQDKGKAFKRINGSLHELQGIGEEAWRSLLATIQAKAHLNPLSWNNIREGQIRLEQVVPSLDLQVHHVLTPEGEIIILEWE
jgi:type II secretory ATPase GspE/PulE/Tfp pilus assembly ATPase PilB-like protein